MNYKSIVSIRAKNRKSIQCQRCFQVGIVNYIQILCLCKRKMNYSKCRSSNKSKEGKALGIQRYLCKDCRYRYSVTDTYRKKEVSLIYVFRRIRFQSYWQDFKYQYVTLYNWVKKWGESVCLPRLLEPLEIVELDEIHTSVQSKRLLLGFDCC